MKRLFCFFALASLLSPSVALAADTTRPTIGLVSPTDVTSNAPVNLTVMVNDNSGIQSCHLYVDSDDRGAMSVTGNIASITYTFPAAQIYTVFVFCHDNAGNINSGANAAVWAHASANGGDTTPPSVGSVSITSATVGIPVTFSVSVSDSGTGVASCNLFAGGTDRGAMTISSGMASLAYAFTSDGAMSAYVQCKDGTNNVGTGGLVTVNVAPAPQTTQTQNPSPIPASNPASALTPTSTSTPAPATSAPKSSSLIKLACPADATADDPCKAVYFYGTDGKRHAFPNEKIFFTWYGDFSGVVEVSADTMANAPLGTNVTYRPGVRMVKFTTDTKVYAIAHGGVLRWVKSESDAAAIYGADWNTKVDDLPDSFFSNYTYGTEITPTDRFSVAGELENASSIDKNF